MRRNEISTDIEQAVRLAGASLPCDAKLYVDCVVCDSARKMMITRSDEGLFFKCFKLSCGVKGFIAGADSAYGKPDAKPERALHEAPVLEPIDWRDYAHLEHRYALTVDELDRARVQWAPDYDRHAWPIITPEGFERGYALRAAVKEQKPKTLTQMTAQGPVQSWHYSEAGTGFGRVLIVEDAASAARCASYVTTVALCGTELSPDRAREIKSVNPDTVILALDADATAKAFGWAQTYGLLFRRLVVYPILGPDFKDLDRDTLADILTHTILEL